MMLIPELTMIERKIMEVVGGGCGPHGSPCASGVWRRLAEIFPGRRGSSA